MRNKPLIMKLIMATLVLFAIGVVIVATGCSASAQKKELLNQLCGKAEAPQRNAAQLAEAYQEAIDYLLPLMSAEDVSSRYDPQIILQDMGSYAVRPGAELEREVLAKAMVENLDAAMPDVVRNWFVRQIQRIGKGESVPALAKLMSADDVNLRDYARQALEKNPDPSATDALLKELASAKNSTWKIGLLNSLGQRGAVSAVPQIVKALSDSDQKVGKAAVSTLSNIGDQASTQALLDVIEKPSSPIYMEAAQGLVDIAQKMASNNDTAGAAKIFETLYENATKMARNSSSLNPFSIRVAAIIGLITCNPDKGAREIANFIRDEDPKVRAAAVQGARLSSSSAPTYALTEILPKLRSDSQVQVLGLLGDRGETSSINSIKGFLNSDDQAVCIAAINALSKIGSEASAQALLEIAVNNEDATGDAAHQGLAVMTGTGVEEFVKAQAKSGNVKTRIVAIPLLSKRQTSGAAEILFRYAAEDNEDISVASFQALSDVSGSIDIASLVELLVKIKSSTARETGITTLRTVLSKAKDKDTAVKIIIAQMGKSDQGLKLSLLTSLDALGGSTALNNVNDAVLSSNEAMRDAAIRTMSDWPDFEATEKLLAIASKSETPLTHYVLALRGVVRLIQTSFSAPLEDREELCLSAFDIARRDEEKVQVISAMGSLPSMKISEKLLELAQDENLKTEAGLAAVQLASNMRRTDRTAAQELAQKILDLNISDDINSRAQNVITGRFRR